MIAAIESIACLFLASCASQIITPLIKCCFDPSFFGLNHALMNYYIRITLLNEMNQGKKEKPHPRP